MCKLPRLTQTQRILVLLSSSEGATISELASTLGMKRKRVKGEILHLHCAQKIHSFCQRNGLDVWHSKSVASPYSQMDTTIDGKPVRLHRENNVVLRVEHLRSTVAMGMTGADASALD